VETTSNKKQWPYGARKENKKAADIHAKTGRQIRVAMEATLEKSRYRERKRSLPVFPWCGFNSALTVSSADVTHSAGGKSRPGETREIYGGDRFIVRTVNGRAIIGVLNLPTCQPARPCVCASVIGKRSWISLQRVLDFRVRSPWEEGETLWFICLSFPFSFFFFDKSVKS